MTFYGDKTMWWGVKDSQGLLIACFDDEDEASIYARTWPQSVLCLVESPEEIACVDDEQAEGGAA